ncbi:MAG: hypothetical protein LH679_21815 [Cyanobacteria bacterium CAN_BIN43]|nr:hypothetical protein [Cyanobacteria bacterium CAN_BIN43]
MSLTVGTTLQHDKLAIEAILHQTDFGVTYQATHPAINHPIILQSFNEALRQRSDFDQLRQKFLQEVLLSSKQPSDTVSVIDCFEENGMPFVVLEVAAEQSIPPLSSWLEIPVEAPVEEIAPPPTAVSVLSVALATAFPDAPAEATVAAPIALSPAAAIKTEEMAIANAEELAPAAAVASSPATLQSFPFPDYATNGSRNGVNVLVSEQKPRKWMPLALLLTALMTGFGGVGLGLALRFKPTPQVDNTSSLSPSWFGQEQSFPPQQDWPITETPNLYSPSSAFEQPRYQSSSPARESGIPNLPPSTDYIPPAQLAPPEYQPEPPGIANYPPASPDAVQSAPTLADPPAPEVAPPVIPLPQPITPETPPQAAPETNKPPSSSPKSAPAAPIFHQ